MKGKKRVFGVVLMITALIMTQLPVTEADAAPSASAFKMEGTTLVKYTGTDKTVSIPDDVEIIGKSAFEDNASVELVVIPASVTKIEPYAFWGCEKLDRVVLGKGLKAIGDFAFANCTGLSDMVLPKNIANVGIQAFVDCVNLREITIQPETVFIHESAFDGCVRLQFVCEKGTYAYDYAMAFYERQKEMPEYEDIPDYVEGTPKPTSAPEVEATPEPTRIPEPEDPTAVYLGSTSVVANSAVVFIDNNRLNVYDGADVEERWKSETSQQDEKESMQPTQGDKLLNNKYCIVDGKVIADRAYYNSQNIEKISLPKGIEEIGQFAFARSTVEEIVLPDTVKEIAYGAFYHCDFLEKVSLSKGIVNVEPMAFSNTKWVKDFKEDKVEQAGEHFLISEGVLVAYNGEAELVTIPKGVRVIAAGAFAENQAMKELVIPDTLLVIGEEAFADCMNLEKVTVGNKVTDIKDRAFAGCMIKQIRLPETLERIGLNAFDESVKISLGGSIPRETYEETAQRLTNEKFREYQRESGEGSVSVICEDYIEEIPAQLTGARRNYTLEIRKNNDLTTLEKAFERSKGDKLPEGCYQYTLKLYDESKIPLTKLGKQPLTILLPLSDIMVNQEYAVCFFDRNGQLEQTKGEHVQKDGKDYLRFSLQYVSTVALIPTGNISTNVTILQMAPPLQDSIIVEHFWNRPRHLVKYLLSGTVLSIGVFLFLQKGKTRAKKKY